MEGLSLCVSVVIGLSSLRATTAEENERESKTRGSGAEGRGEQPTVPADF